jgi:phosphate/sulfate permease
MGIEFYMIAVGLLLAFAIFDLMVGVSNDAVNFLNASIGSRVAPRHIILIIASFGILTGVLFSSGMMEVARKGIFHPQLFTMPELVTVFLGVMVTDIVLLDFFNTLGLPTSTTVSIVFELLGAAVAVSLLKIYEAGAAYGDLLVYINTSKALMIILGILFSVVIAFVFGALVMYLTRLVFTFDYTQKMKRYGAIWAGIAMATITYFILVKGAKSASFITPETGNWIRDNAWTLMGAIFVASALFFHVLLLRGFNILKPVILVGTFALALAFAANDLVNFIGVPLAGLHSYQAAQATAEPLTVTMGALAGKVPSGSGMLLLAGGVMVTTLWLSRKSRTVSETELSLGRQDEGDERFDSTALSRLIVRMGISLGNGVNFFMPSAVRGFIDRRRDTSHYEAHTDDANRPSFDLLRASVNLMVASAVVSYATSHKLPLSTTYVTFMVSMGTSFSDMAWGRESAVYRVTGVLTVISGWFMTALAAFSVAAVFASIVHFGGAFGLAGLLVFAGLILWRSHHRHGARVRAKEEHEGIYNLSHEKDTGKTVATSFEQVTILLAEVRKSLDLTFESLFVNNMYGLQKERERTRKIQRWTNIVCANIFKAMRLLQKTDERRSLQYAQTTRRLQKLADGQRDIVNRASVHIRNHHKGLLPDQIEELDEIRAALSSILEEAGKLLSHGAPGDVSGVVAKDNDLRKLARALNKRQTLRIQDDSSKTRLSILYYAIIGNAMMISKQNLRLLEIFNESFGEVTGEAAFDLD